MTNTNKPSSLDSQNFYYRYTINKLHYDNKWLQAEISNAKQRYKELFDSIKITRDKNNEKITSLLNEIENLKAKMKGKKPVTSCDNVVSKVCACKKYVYDAANIRFPLGTMS